MKRSSRRKQKMMIERVVVTTAKRVVLLEKNIETLKQQLEKQTDENEKFATANKLQRIQKQFLKVSDEYSAMMVTHNNMTIRGKENRIAAEETLKQLANAK